MKEDNGKRLTGRRLMSPLEKDDVIFRYKQLEANSKNISEKEKQELFDLKFQILEHDLKTQDIIKNKKAAKDRGVVSTRFTPKKKKRKRTIK